MNLTVGPLPPAVYWRRRAIVAVGLIAIILPIAFSCGGPDKSDSASQRKTAVTVSQHPSPTLSSPIPSVSSGTPSSAPSTTPSEPGDLSPSPSVAAGATPACADTDMQVTATIESTAANVSRLQLGGTFMLKLKIKNIANHPCTRDVGTDPEELSIMDGSTKIWSSDDCDAATGAKKHDVRTFGPNIMIQANLTWNSYLNTAKSCVKGKTPTPVGTYQLYGRLGTATSAATTFKIEN